MRRKASKPVCSEACTVRLWRLKPNAVAPRSRACKVPLWDARGTGQDARGTCGRSLAPAPNATDAERHRLGQTITFASWPTELAHGGWPTELAHGAGPHGRSPGMRRKASSCLEALKLHRVWRHSNSTIVSGGTQTPPSCLEALKLHHTGPAQGDGSKIPASLGDGSIIYTYR